MTTDPPFRFVEDPHGYWAGDEELPSPSLVFQDLGLVDRRFFTRESRERGAAVHLAIKFALKGTLNWATLHEDLHGYVRSGLALVEHLKPKILRFEAPRFHKVLRFAGTADVVWEVAGRAQVIDWKSGKAPKVARYQTAAYELLEDAAHRMKRAAAELQADGSMARLVHYQDPNDGAGWLHLLGAWRIRRALRARPLDTVGE